MKKGKKIKPSTEFQPISERQAVRMLWCTFIGHRAVRRKEPEYIKFYAETFGDFAMRHLSILKREGMVK